MTPIEEEHSASEAESESEPSHMPNPQRLLSPVPQGYRNTVRFDLSPSQTQPAASIPPPEAGSDKDGESGQDTEGTEEDEKSDLYHPSPPNPPPQPVNPSVALTSQDASLPSPSLSPVTAMNHRSILDSLNPKPKPKPGPFRSLLGQGIPEYQDLLFGRAPRDPTKPVLNFSDMPGVIEYFEAMPDKLKT
ncbi:hypothetical protein KEM55_009018, partial [Ascosphaera atra]